MKNLKTAVLNMPAWKAGVCILLMIFGMSVIFEVILSHTVFYVFDRMLAKFEMENKQDLADLDDMDKSEQRDFCDKYKWLLEEKANLAKRSPSEFSYDFAESTMRGHEQDINFAIQHHQFNLKKCEVALKSAKA
ncbi:MAG: hypothetical protein ACYCQI_09415 [Gammaproteobacteria bacterium]